MTEHHVPNQHDTSPAAAQRPRLINAALIEQLRETVGSVTRPWWQGDVVSENGLIYGVNLGGSRPPLIWCFQGYGEFSALAAALGPDQPLYGMRSGHMVVKNTPENQINMAVMFAEELHSLGLSGPLFIGGNCQAAILAQKIAEIFMASGQPVSLLIELNPLFFTPYAGRAALIFGRYDTTNPLHRLHDAETLLRVNLPHSTFDILPSEHGKLFSGRILSLLSDLVRRRMDEASAAYSGSFPIWSLRAEYTLPSRITMTAGCICDIQITLRNTSDVTWAPTYQSGLSVGNHWRRPDGSMLQWLDGQQPLNRPLQPGEMIDIVLLARAPDREGEYMLEVDMQHAGIAWLSELGVEPGRCNVDVLRPS
ncbi:hypothetical protein [Rhizobium oryziradicis]|nr:hypothetical protein [Rhizobium oryziradicis]